MLLSLIIRSFRIVFIVLQPWCCVSLFAAQTSSGLSFMVQLLCGSFYFRSMHGPYHICVPLRFIYVCIFTLISSWWIVSIRNFTLTLSGYYFSCTLPARLQFHDIACLPPSLSLLMHACGILICMYICSHFLLLGSLIFLVSMLITFLLVREALAWCSSRIWRIVIASSSSLVVIIIANVEVEMAIALRLIVLMLDRGGGGGR